MRSEFTLSISFRQKLSAEGRKRRDSWISRAAQQHPSRSTFSVSFGSGCDLSVITLTVLDHHTFRRLLEKFAPAFERCSPYCTEGMIRRLPLRSKKRGRPHLLSACHCIGLILSWGRSKGFEWCCASCLALQSPFVLYFYVLGGEYFSSNILQMIWQLCECRQMRK